MSNILETIGKTPIVKLKKILSKSFPDKKIVITDNKDGSQTISIM